MTEKLFYIKENPSECEASVLDCRERDGHYEILLDRTVIFPESGGQLCDEGTINGHAILHAREDGDEIWHETDAPIKKGERVRVVLDEAPRLDHTQQHTGEHILSGLASTMYGAVNVGFHMAKDYCTIDLDKPLTDEELDALERDANAAVFRDEETTYRIVSGEELQSIKLRKQAKGLQGEIRIVYAGGVDSCTCCGTHCERAGMVGAIKITDSMKYKGGVRLTFACGGRAVTDAQTNAHIVREIAKRFSVKTPDCFDAVKKQGDELAAMKKLLRERTAELMQYKAAELYGSAEEAGKTKLIVTVEDGISMSDMKLLCEKLCQNDDAMAIVIAKGAEQTLYMAARGKSVAYSMREAIAVINAMLGGKGGGREDVVNGSAKARNDVDDCAAQLRTYFTNVLKKA